MGAQLRLRDSAQFERLLRGGVRRSVDGYAFFIERRQAGEPRLGMLVTRKHARLATRRNAIKRCIREAFRLERHRLGSLDMLVRPPYNAEPGKAMIERLRVILPKVAS